MSTDKDKEIAVNEGRERAIEGGVPAELAATAAAALQKCDGLELNSDEAHREIVNYATTVESRRLAAYDAATERERKRCRELAAAFGRSPRLLEQAVRDGLSVDQAKARAFDAGEHLPDGDDDDDFAPLPDRRWQHGDLANE